DGGEVDVRAGAGQHGGEIGGAVGAGLVGAEVQADHTGAWTGFEAWGDRGQPIVVEAEAVDDGAVLGQAKQARATVAVLGSGRRSADLDEAETGGEKGGDRDRVLVEAGGEAERVRQLQPGDTSAQPGRGDRTRCRGKPGTKGTDCKSVRHLGVDPAQRLKA